MNSIKTTLHHKVVPPGSEAKGPAPLLILLHGRGANEDDLLGLAPYLDSRLFLAAARAPFSFPYGGFMWYEILAVGSPQQDQFLESYDRIVQFVADVKTGYPVDPRRTFLLGFSMGSVMSLAFGLSKPEEIRAVVAHSGYIPEDAGLDFAWNRLAGKGFFVAHGMHDPVIQIQFGRRAHELLSKTRADVTYKEYPIPHTMSEESVADLSAWLKRKIDEQP